METHPWPPQIDSANGYFDLGHHHRHITTSSDETQIWFDRGLLWCYSFHHEEAARCFEQAIKSDPECGMAYWGLAYCLGPNYNAPWDFNKGEHLAAMVKKTHETVQRARGCTNVSPVEKALIEALTFRYPQKTPLEDCSIWNKPYADAMQKVYELFSDDYDVATLYADAMMNLTPWAMWDIKTGTPNPESRTPAVKSLLERSFTKPDALKHPGLVHLYIHLMEMSPTPELALPIAEHLRGMVPDSGHLNHMPSHLDIICGNYDRVMTANADAIRADEKLSRYVSEGPVYTMYRVHNYHFSIYGAMFAGRLQAALDICDHLEAAIPEHLLHMTHPPMADLLESFLSIRAHVLIRFGRWTDIIQTPLPSDPSLYSATTAFLHYAKGVAYAATGDISSAREQRELFKSVSKTVPETRTLFNNTTSDLLNIAAAMLDGEIAYREKDFSSAWSHLERSIALDDSLLYAEPWGWMQPTRHAYGALLLEQGRVEDAAKVYREDLGLDDTLPRPLRHPRNVWALTGLKECLDRSGKIEDAAKVNEMLLQAQSEADVKIQSSCFCRRD